MAGSTWDRITGVLLQEFSDLQDVESLTRTTLRLLLAAVLGGLLGLQREKSGKAAGVRTHMLIAMGSALFVLVPLQAGFEEQALSRYAQGMIAGVGLLCAGTIIKSGDVTDVRGLTTAAGMWLTSAVGLSAAMGRETTAILSAVLAFAILALERPLRRWFNLDPTGTGRRHERSDPPDGD